MVTVSKTYSWVDGARIGVKADLAGPELERLAAKLSTTVDGLPAEEVVKAAAPKSSPLHEAIFKLDDREAALEYRLERARLICRSFVVSVTIEGREPVSYRPFVNLQDGKGYRSSIAVEKDEDLREQRIENAIGYVQAARRVLAEAKGFADVVEALSAIESRIQKKRKRKAA